jgi:hypothetical protein
MSYEEKSSWVLGLMAVVSLTVYVAVTLSQGATMPLTETPYVATMLWTIIGSIVVSIAIHIGLGLFSRDRTKDQRDREFYNFGERVGNGFLIAGALAALIMAWLEVDWFWIANALYLGFSLSGVLSSVAKLVAYRRGIVGAW